MHAGPYLSLLVTTEGHPTVITQDQARERWGGQRLFGRAPYPGSHESRARHEEE